MPRTMAAHKSCTASSAAASMSSLRGNHSHGWLAARRKVNTCRGGGRGLCAGGGEPQHCRSRGTAWHVSMTCIDKHQYQSGPRHARHLQLVCAGPQAGQHAGRLVAALCRQHLAEGDCSRGGGILPASSSAKHHSNACTASACSFLPVCLACQPGPPASTAAAAAAPEAGAHSRPVAVSVRRTLRPSTQNPCSSCRCCSTASSRLHKGPRNRASE